MIEHLKHLVENCNACNYIDKPFILYRVYDTYLHREIRVLVISESPPPGQKESFLYNTAKRDRLRHTLAKFFGIDTDKLIDLLVAHGVLWDMAIRCRPRSRRDLESMARRCSYITKQTIELLKPRKLVLLGRIAVEQFRSIEPTLSYRPPTIVFEKHPLYVIRFEKDRRDEYFAKLRDILFDE